MRYTCTNCNFIYDESLWDSEEGIEHGTKFEHLGDSFECPVCGESWEYFHEITEEINYFPENIGESELKLLSPTEKEHFPHIEKGDDDFIKVVLNHSMEQEHFISSIALHDEYGDVIEEEFFSAESLPQIEFDVSDLDEYEIRVKCNLHGVWGRKVEV